ncbi:MAG: response regulator transcription factor [Spirosomaceae bacterium]|jgi:DNA-binding NarL/FixJ family response regulator|nr:response regulator transcription factor [Spirosomataceae bacterium]
MIRVAIFEDQSYIREFLSEIVRSSEELYFVGAFPNANAVESIIKKHKIDVVLMDIQMPGISGIEAVRLIKNTKPEIQVLIQTVFEDNSRIFSAICAGASGYILKDSSPEKYIDSIIEVYQGGSPMTPAIARKVLTMFSQNNPIQKEYQDLTTTEHKVLECLVKGLSYKLIAAECQVSFSTVNFHLKNIYKKLHVNSATEAIGKALREHLV